MTNLQAISFASKVKVGTLIKTSGMVLRVDEIKEDAFAGQTIYKGKERGLTFLAFTTLLNPHYCKDIEILNA